jgi:hypothetical protein
MGQAKDAGCRRCSGNGGRSGRGRGGCGRSTLATVPCKALELGACKDLEGHIFTIGSGNKGKDREMLQILKEKMATYIGTKFGDNAAQERTSKKQIALNEPVYSQSILDRHGERVKAIKDLITLKVTSLRLEKAVIDDEIKAPPTECRLMTEKQQIKDQFLCCEIKLKDKVEMKLAKDENMAHRNAWQTHHEVADGLKKSRAKIYSLLLGQSTQVIIDRMKQDVDWRTVSDLFDPIALFKLIEKFVLKQPDNQYKMAVLIAKQLSILQFHQDDQVSNATYYDCFTTRLDVACQAGVFYYIPDLLAIKTMELSLADFNTLIKLELKRIIKLVK